MSPAHPNLAALMGSRICHDLISPVGAISNGVELLQMAGTTTGPELELIAESARDANARIGFFRVAFGAASPGQRIGAQEVSAILDGYSSGTRFRFHWLPDTDMDRTQAKIAFLVLLCLETAMPRGGDVHVAHQDGNWQLTGRGERLNIVPDLWQVPTDPTARPEIRAAEVQFLLLGAELAAEGRQMALDVGEDAISVRF